MSIKLQIDLIVELVPGSRRESTMLLQSQLAVFLEDGSVPAGRPIRKVHN